MNLPTINEEAVAALFNELLKKQKIKEEQLWEKNEENREKLTPIGAIIYITFLTKIWNAYLKQINKSLP